MPLLDSSCSSLRDVAKLMMAFDNHSGKRFGERLLKFLCVLDSSRGKGVESSTATAGLQQPGSSSYTKVLLRCTLCSPGGLQDTLQVEILQTYAASDERTQKHQE